jgi:AcrR family transcriptional regulator
MSKRNEERMKESILTSAARLFAKFGPKKTTIDDIAASAGIAKGTIYYYFNDKEEIFARVIKGESDQLFQRLSQAAKESDSPEQKLIALFIEKLTGLAELVNLRWLYDYIDINRWSSLEKETMDLAQKEQKLIEEILEEGKNKGLFAIEDVTKIAQNLVNIFSALAKSLPQGLSPLELTKNIEDMLVLLFSGLRSRSELKPEQG